MMGQRCRYLERLRVTYMLTKGSLKFEEVIFMVSQIASLTSPETFLLIASLGSKM
jgi:hypothetical protein